ncbi:MAG: HAMP domain-containing sensor histidine kinase [Patescibacteria group bacterium]
MYAAFIAPKSSDEDTQRYEFILNTILCCIIPFLLFLHSIIAIDTIKQGAHYHGISLISFNLFILVFGSLLLLSRKGYYKTSGLIFLLFYFVLTTYGAIHWGVELPLVTISYIVIIVISSILISTRFAFLAASVIALSIIGITYLQLHAVINPVLAWKHAPISISDPFELSVVLFVITGVSWLSNREIERSLKRARASEKALLEERNLLEIKVEERTRELKGAQEDKVSQLYRFAEFGKLSSGIFHDLMNVLNVVVINVSRLEGSPEHLPEVQQYVGKAVAASKRLGNHIQSVRKQIASDDAHSVFSPEKEIRDAMDMLQFRAREASVQFRFKAKDAIELHGPALKFYQTVLNLLMNAVDACENNNRTSIVNILLRKASNKNGIVLIIRDNGCGISPDHIGSIFNPLFTTKSYSKGTGIGLSQTKEIIERYFKGSIAVTSTENKGTTFIIRIPLLATHDRPNTTHKQGAQ